MATVRPSMQSNGVEDLLPGRADNGQRANNASGVLALDANNTTQQLQFVSQAADKPGPPLKRRPSAGSGLPTINRYTLEFINDPVLERRFHLHGEWLGQQRSYAGVIIIGLFVIAEIITHAALRDYWRLLQNGILLAGIFAAMSALHYAEQESKRRYSPLAVAFVFCYQVVSTAVIELTLGTFMDDQCAQMAYVFIYTLFAVQSVWLPPFKQNVPYAALIVSLYAVASGLRTARVGSTCGGVAPVVFCVVVALTSSYVYEFSERTAFLNTVGLEADAAGLEEELDSTMLYNHTLQKALHEERKRTREMMLNKMMHTGAQFGTGSYLMTNLLSVVEGVLMGQVPSDEVVKTVKQTLVETASLFEPNLAAALSENFMDPHNKVTAAWLRGTLVGSKRPQPGADGKKPPSFKAGGGGAFHTLSQRSLSMTAGSALPAAIAVGAVGASSISELASNRRRSSLQFLASSVPKDATADSSPDGERRHSMPLIAPGGPGSGSAAVTPAGLERRSSTGTAIEEDENGEGGDADPMRDMPSEIISLLQEDEVMLVLEEMADWNFNAFKLTELTDGHPLATLGFVLFEEHNFYSKYKIDPKKFYNFLLEVEYAYLWNPYHNRTHAADVLASLNMLLVGGGVIDGGYCDDLALFTALISAILHDYGHPGLNNDFLTKSSDPLAILYNDKSVLENHHLSSGWKLLVTPEFDFFNSMSIEQQRALRARLIRMIMATDLKDHFEYLSDLQDRFDVKLDVAKQISRANMAPGEDDAWDDSSTTNELPPGARPDNDKARDIVMQLALKCSDLGHLARQRDVHLQWVSSLQDECFKQGDRERTQTMVVSPMNDRSKPMSASTQVGFFDIIALPMFRSWVSAFPQSVPFTIGVEDNYDYWKNCAQQQAQQNLQNQQNK